VGVVLVSAGPDAAVKDAVALAGACAFGTEPFVPTSARAAAADVSTPAVTLMTFERAGLGAAAAMASACGARVLLALRRRRARQGRVSATRGRRWNRGRILCSRR
jgi:hypothetical protein